MFPETKKSWTLLVLFNLLISASCFQVDYKKHRLHVGSRSRILFLHSKPFGDDPAFDDEIGKDIVESRKGGEDLAKDFFKEMKKREQKEESESSSMPTSSPSLENQRNTMKMPQLIEEGEKAPGTKFTGRSSQPSPERFMSSGRQTTAGPGTRTPKEIMMEREYELVGNAEKGLAFQAAFAVLALTFYIYIGISGGITNRSQESLENFGGDDMLPFEQLVPLQKDRESSVWL
jgi:hypothetical protein